MLKSLENHRWLWGLAALITTGCADAQFDVRFAPGFTEERTTVSVFGVFRDGRMDPEAWAEIGAPLSAAFSPRTCEVAYGDKLQGENPALFTRIDDAVKADGITDELLDQLARAASGEVIMTIAVHGRAGSGAEGSGAPLPVTMQGPLPGSRVRGSPARATPSSAGKHLPNGMLGEAGLQISASLFSVRLHRSIAKVNMKYSGASTEDAVRQLAEKLRAVVPGSTCSGWSFGGPSPLERPQE